MPTTYFGIDASVESMASGDTAARLAAEFGMCLFEEYKKFMTLKVAARDWSGELLCPPPLVAKVWRAHVCENSYAMACLNFFGKVVEFHPLSDSLVRRFATIAALRARFADHFDHRVWNFDSIIKRRRDDTFDKVQSHSQFDKAYAKRKRLASLQGVKLVLTGES